MAHIMSLLKNTLPNARENNGDGGGDDDDDDDASFCVINR